MHRAATIRCLKRAPRLGGASLFSPSQSRCAAVTRSFATRSGQLPSPLQPATYKTQQRNLHVDASPSASDKALNPDSKVIQISDRKIPVTCSGCGAFSQTSDPQQFGYFDLTTKRVRDWLEPKKHEKNITETSEDSIVNETLKTLDSNRLESLGLDPALFLNNEAESSDTVLEGKPPVCNRCHSLMHHGGSGDAAQLPMFHPTVESLRETIEESPHKYNHIYHVVDAADFPMSLVPRLNVLLGDIPLRTRNRRSRSAKYIKDRQIELSFIITRSDLLGPTKEKVDRMMPYLREVLRDALGRVGHRVRLGNVRCVSAKRGWWTKAVREDIWSRGGAGWMVGKVNVGKSQLFEAVYPKGRLIDLESTQNAARSIYPRDVALAEDSEQASEEDRLKNLEVDKLLPPPQPLKQYPDMPIVSSLPGTTASPIRIPFGNSKGELIDLPGLARSDLELYVRPERRQSLIMKSRIVPEQVSVTSNNSLLLGGGLIRITPRTPNLTFLMYNFTPLHEHLTNNDKAIEFQNQTRISAGVENITLPGMGEKMKHAGTFKLRHDVTKRRAGPLTRNDAVGLKVENLPFRVLSVDILIEGVGYVEIVAQVRTRNLERTVQSQASGYMKNPPHKKAEQEELPKESTNDPFADMVAQRRDTNSVVAPVVPKPKAKEEPEPEELAWPAIDVFSPEGQFIGSRQPIHGWLTNKPLVKDVHKRSRPRKSMKGQKKKEKMERRAD